MLQTKSVQQKLVNWVQFRNYSEWTTRQKMIGIVLNEKYLDGLMSLKSWIDYIQSFWRTEEEMAKNRPEQPKSVKKPSFSLISQWRAKTNHFRY